jgi:hypothetical protein
MNHRSILHSTASVSALLSRVAAFAAMGVLLAIGGAAFATASAEAAHYCPGAMSGGAACEWSPKVYVGYNEVDANADAVCEALSNAAPPPLPLSGVLYTPQDCIHTGATSAGLHYSASNPTLYPWIGNRHSYTVTIATATHFDLSV